MKQSARSTVLIALTVALSGNSLPVLAATGIVVASHVGPRIQTAASGRVSDRLIVKFKPSSLLQGMSANTQLMQPLSAGIIVQLQAVANTSLSESHAISNGAHVITLGGQPDRQAMDSAIAAISSLSNVEYVEEDRILTAQAVPNDGMYYTVTDNTGTTCPGLWGLWPVTTNAASAVGNPGSYGGDFQDAWNTSTGAGVVVAVVDSGITPNIDIVGSSQKVAAGLGSNLISVGYDFISDCRVRGINSTGGCAANTVSHTVAPTPDATDTGDWITAQDKIDNPNWATIAISDSSWHGTMVSGIIAALGNNNFGVIGGAYGAKILPVRVLGKGGGSEGDVAEAIKWAAGVHSIANPHPAKVINLSLGTSGSCNTTMQAAIDAAVAAGAVVVVAAGNGGLDAKDATPANCNNVISVAAIGRDGSRALYSNYSTTAAVTLAAPGGDDKGVAGVSDLTYDPGIWSTWNAGTTVQITPSPGHAAFAGAYGTSMAAPHVSAAAALLLSKNSTLTPAQIKNYLTTYTTPFPSFAAGTYHVTNLTDCSANLNCGAGILNAALAVQNTPAASGSISSGSGSGSGGSGGGGGGCSVMPFDTNPDVSLLLAMLAVGAYWLRRRIVRARGAA